MALVEYSSSSGSEADQDGKEQQRPSKRRRTSPPPNPPLSASKAAAATATAAPSAPGSSSSARPNPKLQSGDGGGGSGGDVGGGGGCALPPLPSSFHDLYASTVRTATADLPSLHHGRRRVIPHKEGNWPSHIYTEWHPSAPQHALLRSLLASLAGALGPELARQSGGGGGGHALAGFLESGLGAPLPLHVSLSRPFVLRTGDKDGFLGRLVGAVEGSGVRAFALVCDGLSWHRSPDSERSFLVLRVRSSSPPPGAAAADDGDAAGGGGSGGGRGRGRNPELSTLLSRCNDLVSSYGQPRLYAAPRDPGGEEEGGGVGGDDAFHISIAWSFASPTDEICRRTAEVFARPEFQDRVAKDIMIPVEGVKAKIGNVVTNIGLLGRKKGRQGSGLFGV